MAKTFVAAAPPENEAHRLSALHEYQLLDTPPEEAFDAFTRLAAQVCGTPISLISLIDERRQWFKSNIGLSGVSETQREIAFCAHTILEDGILEVPDAQADERFAENPLVTGDPNIRFYAGVPLITGGGIALGTLCVIDRKPRHLSAEQRASLRAIADALMAQFETRRATLLDKERIELLSAAMEAAQDAIIIVAPSESSAQPSRVVYVNAAFLKQKGATLEDVIGKPSDVYFGPKTDLAKLEAMRSALLRGEESRIEYITYRKDGSAYYTESAARPLIGANGETSHYVVLQRDITDAVLRGMTLVLQNERLTTLTSIARGLFAALDRQPLVAALLGAVHELGGGTGRLLAIGADGSLRETTDLTFTEDDLAANDAMLQSAITSEVAIVSDESRRVAVRVLGPSGTAAFVLDVGAGDEPLTMPDIFAIGLLAQYFAVAVRNVELYGELASRRAAVIELNQVKNDLIAMLAHDFKGPLTTIVGFADVLAEDPRFDAESRQFLGMISSSALRLASLATDTLALSRLEQNELSLELTRVDLSYLVRDVTRVFSVTRSIEVRNGDAPLVVTADEGRLRQVLENLIGNAIKYSPGGEPIEVALREKRGGVEISVRDRGIGIPKADVSKLFGRFARANNARALGIGGTGFGLYLARTIIDMHGGQINVESKEGTGSTFRVFLPAMPPPQRAANRRILLLDAEGDARSYIAHTLRAEGYPVTVATEEGDFLRALDEDAFDAAIVDVDRLSATPEVFVANVAGRVALVRLGRESETHQGWDAVLSKPFLLKDLQVALNGALTYRAAGRAAV